MLELWPGRGGPQIDYISNAPSEAWQVESPRRLVILGSTGSIGSSALEIVRRNPSFFSVLGLAAGRNVQLLSKQAIELKPPYLAVQTKDAQTKLQSLLPEYYKPCILVGREGYIALASLDDATTILSAQSGAAGLAGTLAAALRGRVICLANKESLVLAGSLVREICSRTGAVILPVDSEHNAVFQCLAGLGQDVESLILTASGGPFREMKASDLSHVTLSDALQHPNWKMGKKITIDSATMMNKGLEVIEAYHLYGVLPRQIEILIHPQSIVHSMVRFHNGGLLAQLATADMKLPLASCLLWPYSMPSSIDRLDLSKGLTLSFQGPDLEKFPCLRLAQDALRLRGGRCVVLNAANEAAVSLFLAEKCAFTDIPKLIEKTLQAYSQTNPGNLPFCTRYDEEKENSSLSDFVWKTEKRIRKLDTETRNKVRDYHLRGDF